jgi:2-iminobutanoate/2-iminopropanoate deaminase
MSELALQPINSDRAPRFSGPFSHAVKYGNLVFVGGQGPFTVDGQQVTGDFSAQVRATLNNVSEILKSAGSSLADVLKVNIFITDLADMPALNEVYREFFAEPFPVRTTVQVGLPGFDVEIEVVAAVRD